jgi:predicted PurR-regulated permease PerM
MEDFASQPWLRRLLVAALLAGLILLSFQVLQPFIVPLLWAGILAYVTWPLYQKVVQWCGGRKTLATLVVTIALTAAVIVPTVALVSILRVEFVKAYQHIAELLAQGGPRLPEGLLKLPWIGDWLRELSGRMAADPRALGEELRQLLDRSFGEIATIVGGLGRNIAKILIAVLSLFFMYRDGQLLASQITRALEQVLGDRIHHYLVAVGQTVKAVVYGLVSAALAQGTLAGVGYWIAGLNAPVFLAALTTGKTWAGVFLLIWGATAISWIDNVVRPFVISSATRIPFLLVMFGVLGGLAAFGLVGLFIGPVILAVLIAVWREWLAETRA